MMEAVFATAKRATMLNNPLTPHDVRTKILSIFARISA
jgi:hypothetical protein